MCRDRQVLSRYSAHSAMLFLVLGALMLAQIRLPAVSEGLNGEFDAEGDLGQVILTAWTSGPRSSDGYLVPAVVPRTARADGNQSVALGGEVLRDVGSDPQFESREFRAVRLEHLRTEGQPPPRTEIQIYKVRSGDNVYQIAQRFGITPETIVWANEKLLGDDPHRLNIGDELLIPPVSGVVHVVQKNDTLEKIARSYKVDPSVILAFAPNRIQEPAQMTVGQLLMVPGGQKPEPVQQAKSRTIRQPVKSSAPPVPKTVDAGSVVGSGEFRWPTTGVITQKFWSRHPGIDIAAPKGTPVFAADGGTVVEAGWNTWGYGYSLVIDLVNGYPTRYAHLSWFNPNEGQVVEKGELIGQVGSTGRSSGPHLHFEISSNGRKLNPFTMLP